jgi:hypothetical protein
VTPARTAPISGATQNIHNWVSTPAAHHERRTRAAGRVHRCEQRQDIQLNKVNINFQGWLMSPKFNYVFYVWTQNTAQGQPAQVVLAGNCHR